MFVHPNNPDVNRIYTSEEAEIREINRETGNGAVAFLQNGPDELRQARAIGFPRGYLNRSVILGLSYRDGFRRQVVSLFAPRTARPLRAPLIRLLPLY